MDTRTGKLVTWQEVEKMPPHERKHFVEVKRDISAYERATNQIKLYSPCACGSGKKLKFCCYRK